MPGGFRNAIALAAVIAASVASVALGENRETSGPAKGSLVIMGGGGPDRMFPGIFGKFVELAGGKEARLVIVPTAGVGERGMQRSGTARLARAELGVASAIVLHTRDRAVADSEEFVKPLQTATGVWFDGGRQWRLTKAYGGTRTEREFHAVLARGGSIGGSSAGATIQGSFLARGDTSGNTIMIGDVQRGFGFLRNATIDQHLIARGRERDLLQVLEDPEGRMRPGFRREDLLGIGIDEDVAIVVQGRSCEVIGKAGGAVLIYDPRKWTPGLPDEEKWLTLRTGARYDLKRRKIVENPPKPSR